jgi:hypothetical protein
MNKFGLVLCAVLICSYTVNAQLLSGLTSPQAFTLGLGLPIIFNGLRGGGGVGYPIPPPPRPFLLPPPMYRPFVSK